MSNYGGWERVDGVKFVDVLLVGKNGGVVDYECCVEEVVYECEFEFVDDV